MRIGIDFDRVLFDTDSFDEYYKEETGLYHVDQDVFTSNGNYSPEKHAEACGIDIEKVYNAIDGLEKFLYDDVDALNKLEDHEIVLVTRGKGSFQRKKVEASGVEKFVNEIKIIESGPKSKANIDLLVDDLEKEIEKTEVPSFLFDRDIHDVEDIIKFVRAEEVFNRYDVRGEYLEQVNESFAGEFGKALGTFVAENGGSKLVVCRDNKKSSEELKDALTQGIRSVGVDVIDVGKGPTDYAAFAGVEENAHSVQVTSSHLPLDTNGFKMMYPEGNGLVNEDLERIKNIFRRKSFRNGEGEVIETSYAEKYRQEAIEYAEDLHDASGRKVVYESMGGAGTVFVPDILRSAGFEVVDLSEDHDRPHIDPPNPKPELLEHVRTEVEASDADIGLATDMDADRVALYFDGEWIDGNTLFAVFAQLVDPEKLVASIDTSQAVEESFDGQVSYTRVGDPFVIDKTLELNAALSGEPNGHYCFTDFVPYNSGTLAALILAGVNLENRLEKASGFHNLREVIEVQDKRKKMENIIEEVEASFEPVSKADGICYRSGESRVLIRPSGSSSKIRAIADSKSKNSAREALDEAVEIIENA